MDRKKELERLKKEYQGQEVPQEALEGLRLAIERAKKEKERMKMKRRYKNIGVIAAAAVAVVVVLPNTSSTVAKAMTDIPVLGSIARVFTFRDYKYQDDYHDANIEVPKIEVENSSKEENKSVNQINGEVEKYTQTLIDQFKKDVEETGKSYKGLDVTYKVVTDTKDWFTLRVDVTETMASGYDYSRYYHINRKTGKVGELNDIFKEGSNYVETISNEIKRQMREQMAEGDVTYWLDAKENKEDNFEAISEKQNFYFSKAGELVITFNKYEVAPGVDGCPEFTISNDLIKDIRQ